VKPELTPVRWNGQLVGYIKGGNLDNYHFYGGWVPESGPHTDAFLHALQVDQGDEGVLVSVGKLDRAALASCFPEDGELELRPYPN